MPKTIDVLVIGTEPPCPRCDLLGILVAEATPPDVVLNLRHWAFDSPEAQALGRRLERRIGTAKQVAGDAGISMDWESVSRIVQEKQATLPRGSRPADAWTPELDAALTPCQRIAESAGYLMTPVLIIDGRVAHHGSVPSKTDIAQWLTAAPI